MLSFLIRSGPIAATFLLLLAAAPAVPALAAGNEDPETLIRQGTDLRRKGQDVRAYGYFERAYEISRTARTIAQFGLASQAVGKLVEAEALLSEALSKGDPWVDANHDVIQGSLDSVRKRLGRIAIVGAPPKSTVQVGRRAAIDVPSDGLVWVMPGESAVRVDVPGQEPIARTVTVVADEIVKIEIERPAAAQGGATTTPSGSTAGTGIGTATAAGDAPRARDPAGGNGTLGAVTGGDLSRPASEPGRWSGRQKAGVALAAGGAAALVTGLAFQLLRESRAGGFNDAGCQAAGSTVTGPGGCQSRYDGVQTARNLAIAGYAGALVLGGAGAILFFTGRHADDSGSASPTAATTDRAIALRCAPALGGGFSGALCAARF